MIPYANRATSGPRAWGAGTFASWLLSSFLWAFAAVFVMFVLGGLLGFALVPPAAVTGPFVGFVFLLIIGAAMRDIRRRRALAALVYLEQAVRLNLPLTPILASSRVGERRGVARRLMHLEQLLDSGASVSDAVEIALPELPARSVRIMRAAERLGRLPQGLRRVTEENRPRQFHDPVRVFYRAYPLVLLAMVSLVVMLLVIFVFPKFEAIFHDFGLRLPAVTIVILRIGDSVLPVIFGAAAVLVVLLATRAMWDIFSPRRARLAVRWLTDPVQWFLPVARRRAVDRGLADICLVLADATEAGMAADRALAEAAALDLNLFLARRIGRWRERVDAGGSLAGGAREAGLPPLLVGMLETAAGDLPDVFRFLHRYYSSRFSRADTLLRAAMVPAVAIAMGAVVTLIGLGLFVPMLMLINSISDHMRRVL